MPPSVIPKLYDRVDAVSEIVRNEEEIFLRHLIKGESLLIHALENAAKRGEQSCVGLSLYFLVPLSVLHLSCLLVLDFSWGVMLRARNFGSRGLVFLFFRIFGFSFSFGWQNCLSIVRFPWVSD